MKRAAEIAITVFLLGSFAASNSQAGFMVQPVSVSTDMGTSASTDLDNVINQSGLSVGYTSGITSDAYTATHTDSFGNVWISDGSATGFVSFDLGSVLQLTEYRLWNSQFTSGGFRLDVVGFTLFSDNDSDPTNGPGSNLGSFSAATGNSPHPMQSFGISANTQFVHMQITSNLGGSVHTSFGEAAFVSAVPEPSTCASIGLGLIGLAGYGRRQRKRKKSA